MEEQAHDKHFALLDYLMQKPSHIMDWVGVPAGLSGELCFDACGEGLIESYCETETYEITHVGIARGVEAGGVKDELA